MIVIGVALALGTLAHWPDWLNGPYYWKWRWTRLAGPRLYAGFAVAAVPLLAGLLLYQRGRLSAVNTIGLATLSAIGLRLAWVIAHSPGGDFSYLTYAVRHPWITSFYADAETLAPVKGWLARYHEISLYLNVHSRNKPPGPILFYLAFIKLLGDSQRAALIGGLALAVLQGASVIACAFLLHVLSRDQRVTVWGSCYFALCPGFVLPYPMFDPLYTLLVAPLVALWVLALEQNRLRYSIAAGTVLTLASLMMFNFLVIGFFMAAFVVVLAERNWSGVIFRLARHGAAVLGVCAVIYLAVHLATGYDPLRTFAAACRNQKLMESSPLEVRPYPRTIVFDLTDFALGSGWMSVALAGLWLATKGTTMRGKCRSRITLLCLLQLLVVAVSGLLAAETLRVWNFLLPLLMLPVGLELERFRRWGQAAVFIALWLVLAAMAQNMTFH